MAHYRVSLASGHRLMLEDSAGRRHIARSLHVTVPVGAELHGPRPARGFAILAGAATRHLCRVIFEEIDCSGIEGASGPPPR